MQFYVIFILICGVQLQPLILETTNRFCTIHVGKKKLVVLDKLWTISNENFNFYMNFCDTLRGTPCPDDAFACITSNLSLNIFNKSKMILENDLLVESSNYCQGESKKRIKLHILFDCLDNLIETPELTQKNSCEYELKMAAPQNLPCTYPQCTMNLVGHLFDLRPLKGLYFVKSDSANFSVALCQTNKNCKGQNVTACKLSATGSPAEPLASKTLMTFHDNEVHIRSSYGTNKLEIIAKCNWDKTTPDIYYIKPMYQGKKYRFHMETSYACIKVSTKCEIPYEGNGDLFYNLTKLYNETGYWQVGNTMRQSRMLLNICGSLKLDTIENNCSKSLSQVCKIDSNGNYINLGSIQTKFTITNNVLTTKFDDGVTCLEDTSKKYNTIIEFRCSRIEEGPAFQYSNDCSTYLIWNTPHACPQLLYKNVSCNTTSNEIPECSLSLAGYRYDLSELTHKNNYYTVPDSNNASIEYMLNVCQPVMDSVDIPCTSTDMVFVKYVDEVDQKRRMISLGRMINISVIEDNIAINTAYGTFFENNYYSSTVYFSCSEKDEPPHLLNNTACHYNFLFKTKAACPNPQDLSNTCEFRHPYEDVKIKLHKLRNPFIKVSTFGSAYIFDICSGRKDLCDSNEHCIYGAMKKQLYIFDRIMYVDFSLDKNCTSDEDFNRTLIQLECDAIQNNDNYKIIGTKGCILYIKLSTNLACLKKNVVLPIFNIPSVNKSNYEIAEQTNISTQSTIITNPYTGYSLDLEKYDMDLQNISNRKISFFYSNNSLMVDYGTNISCTNGQFNKYQYHINMLCVKDNHQTDHFVIYQKLHCLAMYTLQRPEVCNLLNRNAPLQSSSSGTMAYTIVALIIIVILCLVGFIGHKKWQQRRQHLYLKEGDL